jgi:sigma-B regulation protein RsbU (phosphoserine phosphatase)
MTIESVNMRSLVAWDDPDEADLIALYLGVDEQEGFVTTDREEFVRQAEEGGNWDIILMSIGTADDDADFEFFRRVRRLLPDCPIVGACHASNLIRVARYITNGMRSHVTRDAAGDYMFLLQVALESTVEAVRAEREQLVSERLREEIESVRKLQQSIIPKDLDSPAGYQVAGRYESSQIRVFGGQPVVMAGGDYYDIFMLDDKSMVFLVGDASGHGMKACMSIMTMHTLVRMIRSDAYRDTASFVAEVNQRLCEQAIVQDEGGFITLLYGILNAETHEFQWTSAGHPIPMLQELETGIVRPLGTIDDGGLPLAIIEEAEYDTHSSHVPPNCRLLIYTDGLEEAFPDGNRDHDQFGIEGIERTLLASAKVPIEEAIKALFDESEAYTKGAGRHDDTSVVLLERE